MKYLVWIISSINVWFGANCLLNVLHILQNSKYSQGSTKFFAVVFLLMAAGGFYFSTVKVNLKLGLLIALGPWILSLAFLLVTMMTSDYK